MKLRLLVSCVICIGICADSSVAQKRRRSANAPAKAAPVKRQPPVPPMPVLPDLRSDPDVQSADVALIANITARELCFEVVPNPTVEFLGKDKTKTLWHADRYNLPDKVEPGVTYRNIGIRLKITSRLADIERIVAEALGELPVNDQAQRQENNIASPNQPIPSNKSTLPVCRNEQQVPHE